MLVLVQPRQLFDKILSCDNFFIKLIELFIFVVVCIKEMMYAISCNSTSFNNYPHNNVGIEKSKQTTP